MIVTATGAPDAGEETMPEKGPKKPVEEAFRKLEETARVKDVALDASFFDELENYSRHKRVEDLPEPALEKVIEKIGEEAIERADEPEEMAIGNRARVGGGAVRATLFRRCRDPFSDCSRAARSVLDDEPGEW